MKKSQAGKKNPNWKGANIVYNDGVVAKIKSASGDIILIDSEDVKKIKDRSWCIVKNRNDKKRGIKKYAFTRINNKTVLLHRFLMNPQNGLIIDHKNRNGLDNRKENLRIYTYTLNNYNSEWSEKMERGNNKLGTGIQTRNKKFYVSIKNNGVNVFLGVFESLKNAKKAYMSAKVNYIKGQKKLLEQKIYGQQ